MDACYRPGIELERDVYISKAWFKPSENSRSSGGY